jgi:hypothetical protein
MSFWPDYLGELSSAFVEWWDKIVEKTDQMDTDSHIVEQYGNVILFY